MARRFDKRRLDGMEVAPDEAPHRGDEHASLRRHPLRKGERENEPQIEMAGPLQFQPKSSRTALQCPITTMPSGDQRRHDNSREDTHAVQGFAENACECSAEEWQARVDLAAAHRLALHARFQRRHLQPSDLRGAGPQRPLLPDPVRDALVRGDGVFLHGSRHRRRPGQARRRARSSAPAIASTRRSTRRCRRPRRCFTPTCPMRAR